MAFFDKINQVAKNIGDKTNDVIETTKLNSKISTEKHAAKEEFLKIGEYYYKRFLEGKVDDEVLAFCESAKEHLDAADQMQADIDRIKMDNMNGTKNQDAESGKPAVETAQFVVCKNCGMNNLPETAFCVICGSKMAE